MKVIKIFDSIQGEGIFVGVPTTFIRLPGCNLRCTWCDTKYAMEEEGQEADLSLLENILPHKHVCITGGEPMIHNLLPLLRSIDDWHFISIETNGTISSGTLLYDTFVDLWTISPKLGSSGMKPNMSVLEYFVKNFADRMQFKFVLLDEIDVRATHHLIHHLQLQETNIPITLQVESARFHTMSRNQKALGFSQHKYLEELKSFVRLFLENEQWRDLNVRVLPQLHKLLWGQERGR